jgi:CO/xanthine dehydrogenase FAD-binding subunit
MRLALLVVSVLAVIALYEPTIREVVIAFGCMLSARVRLAKYTRRLNKRLSASPFDEAPWGKDD